MILSKKNWEKTFTTFLEMTYEPLKKNNHKWVVMGSIASLLQGCKLDPQDVDILVKKPETVHFLCNLLSEYVGKKKYYSF